MKKKLFVLLMILILSVSVFVGCKDGSHEVNIEATKYEGSLNIPENLNEVDGLYNDSSETIEEMKKTTENIFYGEVVNVEEVSSLAVRVSVKVLDSQKGKFNKDHIIYISQIGTPKSEEVLVIGKQYILFVNLNEGSENTYYIRAGVEGVFNISEDSKFISSQLEKWKIDLAKTFKLKKDDENKVEFNDFEKYLKLN